MASRRAFLTTAAGTAVAAALPAPAEALCPKGRAPRPRDAGADVLPPLPPLRERFPDLRRQIAFDYYPWYGTEPVLHWDQWGRRPPIDVASQYMPALGAYDALSTAVLEQHARWIADSGVGAVNLSWWGPGTREDRAVPRVAEVMGAHGIAVGFHVEPYADDHGARFADDVLYLLRTHGAALGDRLWQPRRADGSAGPVFKGFRCFVPERATDCFGVTRPVPDYTPDDTWRRQNERLRAELRGAYDHVTLLADTLDMPRAQAGGFDGVAVYDAFVPPEDTPLHAAAATRHGLFATFPVNAGFDGIAPRTFTAEECPVGPGLAPAMPDAEWTSEATRERAAQVMEQRIRDSLAASVAAQCDPRSIAAGDGRFLLYVVTFNEWHEGTSFEPMRDAEALSPAERAIGYHNPRDGAYRLRALTAALRAL